MGGAVESVGETVLELAVDQEITPEMEAAWREGVVRMREQLFRRNWKNRRSGPRQKSRKDVESFQFILEWYDEFDEVVGRQKERNRLDRLISEGKDVNAPENRL